MGAAPHKALGAAIPTGEITLPRAVPSAPGGSADRASDAPMTLTQREGSAGPTPSVSRPAGRRIRQGQVSGHAGTRRGAVVTAGCQVTAG